MDVFECAAVATVIQVAIWLVVVAIKTPDRARRIVQGKRKAGPTLDK